ncbi:hypothetical protein GOBAR_AA01653 [Gossypium barbadense]|uniref:Uncharacterized protein n=1 Tax=Gossypium barbadense TaxID=3634 RepID=A0A2P5YTK8_GOSBA|nr:hypothetical protein GOBAR_AA01653 [Gossypium barbadense]
MVQGHEKLDLKLIYNCIMPMVKDMPTILISVLIVDIQSRFTTKSHIRKHGRGKTSKSNDGRTHLLRRDEESDGSQHMKGILDVWTTIFLVIGNFPGNRVHWLASRYPGSATTGGSSLFSMFRDVNFLQYVDEIYILELALRIWENEFPTFWDVSTWELPLLTFELILNSGLRRVPKGQTQAKKFWNDMDMKGKGEPKHYGLCRMIGHNLNKCLH